MTTIQKKYQNKLNKLPPQDIEIEKAILGTCIQDKNAILKIIELIKPEDFYKVGHQQIYSIIFQMFCESEQIDLLTVTQKLRKNGFLDNIGVVYVSQLTSHAFFSNVIEHAKILKEYSIRRKLFELAESIQNQCFDLSLDIFDTVSSANESIFNLTTIKASKIKSTWELSEKYSIDKKDESVFFNTGFQKLDKESKILKSGRLIVMAGRPGMGKTSFFIDMARNASEKFRTKILIFSLEMTEQELYTKLLTQYSEVETERIDKHRSKTDPYELPESDYNRVLEAERRLQNIEIYVEDTAGLSINEITSKIKHYKQKYGIEIVGIDYLQLIGVGDGVAKSRNLQNDNKRVGYVSQALKNCAKTENVPIVILSQLSRKCEERSDKHPIMSDLRDSGEIEQNADVILFFYRPAYYGQTKYKDIGQDDFSSLICKKFGVAEMDCTNTIEIHIAKFRGGKANKVITMNFRGEFTKFEELEVAP